MIYPWIDPPIREIHEPCGARRVLPGPGQQGVKFEATNSVLVIENVIELQRHSKKELINTLKMMYM